MKKLTKVLILVIVAVMLFGTVYSSAANTYDTYTYSIDGEPLMSPTAYSALDDFDAIDMNLAASGVPSLKTANDIVADEKGNLYIADSDHNRIVVLNKYYEYVTSLSSYVDENNKEQTLKNPKGVFVTDPNKTADGESFIYVCDTDNFQVVIFDRDYNYVRTIEKPDSPILTKDAFTPTSIAVDIYGRIFIVSTSCYEGVIVLSSEGDFTGFIGAQKVTFSLIQMIWRRFQTKEQREASVKNIAVAYNNITVDEDGFIYVTSNTTKQEEMMNQYKAIKSKSSTYSPVKKLNSQGTEIMKRNGFFDPGGEVAILGSSQVSQITDVSVGNEGSWTILDKSRSRMFTYDQNGNLLFAFGNSGDQLGNGIDFVAMTYQVVDGEYRLVLLDNSSSGYKITVYSPTSYCDTIMAALHNQNENNYSQSIYFWQDVLTQNNNFDLAYIGIGKALYSQGKYEEAQEMLSSAYETEYYSKAFIQIRNGIVAKWLLPLVILIIAVIVLFLKFLGYAKRKNKATSLKVGRKTYWEELLYAFHLVFHPFDGFWDLKHEKRGSVRAATTILAIATVSLFYQSIGKGYTFNTRGADDANIFLTIGLVAAVVLLFCVSNWCLTTLFEGEGSFRDIYIATGYSLAPLPIFLIVSTLLSNVLTITEGSIVNLVSSLGFVWVGLLLFFGVLVTHDYSIGKNFITVLGTIVAMLIILFVIVLFASLVVQMVTFIIAIFSEIGNRIA